MPNPIETARAIVGLLSDDEILEQTRSFPAAPRFLTDNKKQADQADFIRSRRVALILHLADSPDPKAAPRGRHA